MNRRFRPVDPFVARMEAKRRVEWAARLTTKPETEPPVAPTKPSLLARVVGWWTSLRNLLLNVVGTAIFIGASMLLYDGVMQPTIAISPISVPETLEKSGYTSEIAANELRAALNKVVADAKSAKKSADVAGRSDIPDIVVPRTGLSVETIAAQVRKLFGLTNRWQATGGISIEGDQYKLQLKIANDKTSLVVSAPSGHKEISRIMDTAAREILDAADTYLLAASYYDSDPNKSIELANKIIEREPNSEVGGFWAHTLLCDLVEKKRDFNEALLECEKAIAFERKRQFPFEVPALIAGIFGGWSDSKSALPRNMLGIVLADLEKLDEAIVEFKKAIELAPKVAAYYNNLGNALQQQEKFSDAVVQFKKAIELNPSNDAAYYNLGVSLASQENFGEATIEIKKAIKLLPKDADFHYKLGVVLQIQKKLGEAIGEYKKAIVLNPKYTWLYIILGNALTDADKHEEAIAEFRRAVELEPLNSEFRSKFKDALVKKHNQNKPIGTAQQTKRLKR
ncbi:tetratricopeptide repeat protein [Methylocystis sp. B8]|uniref:tetratricopeptide repeat protein n=1 Tax=Methylocystis sp. B8 TaxID=544938 RepID=UPI0010FE3769|nr:tetratricopeptide repeat protein [Methylocystis sp. B8]TLG79017.1 tetratricopeptide repeat protein [Methylocystis sp. B8]